MQFPLRICPLCTNELHNLFKLQNCKYISSGFFFEELGDETKVSATSTNYFFGYKMAQNGHILRGREKKKVKFTTFRQ
jgi:hypothetical protein